MLFIATLATGLLATAAIAGKPSYSKPVHINATFEGLPASDTSVVGVPIGLYDGLNWGGVGAVQQNATLLGGLLPNGEGNVAVITPASVGKQVFANISVLAHKGHFTAKGFIYG